VGGFIGIGGYKKVYLVKMGVLLLEICIGRGVKQKDFGRYLLISSEIKGIIEYPMNVHTMS
jgi:hypothetical protein